MSKSEAYETGAVIRRDVMGPALADRLAETVYRGPNMEKFTDYSTEAVFGLLWSRPGLDHKTRSLISMISDVCGHCWPELELHVRFARRHGWTEDEIVEALLHLCGYVGVPSVREALIVADKVFAELRAEE